MKIPPSIKTISLIGFLYLLLGSAYGQQRVYVSTKGSDKNMGTLTSPVQTLPAALSIAGRYAGKDVRIYIQEGVYSLKKTVEINTENCRARSLTLSPYLKGKVVISGSTLIHPVWTAYHESILRAKVSPGFMPDQLFMNGKELPMARYPNVDTTARVYFGTSADALSEQRIKKWKHPAGGYIHALHEGEWGDFHFRIKGKDANGQLTYEGGWQNNRPAPIHKEYRFVENIFEELDAPGEWYYDKANEWLYLYPLQGSDPSKALFTMSGLTDLIHLKGTQKKPLRNISINNIEFTQTARTFMLVKEPLLRSDWCIYRGGAVLLEGTQNVHISNCAFYELGGNALFLSNYNQNDTLSGNHIYQIGANAIAFVGSPKAVRSPAFRYELFVPRDSMDYKKGPLTLDYPQYCVANDNLIHHIGRVEKQVTGVEVSMSFHIKISHNTIYHVPRAGINISEGTWGGHDIAFNDVFNTVLETGDHGAFNSWGRDRYWLPQGYLVDSIVAARPGIQFLDVVDPIRIHNNRFQCEHGWDIDLDDGSSNYKIYNNVCLSGGLKLREGYDRTVSNNILFNNTFHPHVWLKNSGDTFERNIVTLPYAPINDRNWGKSIDHNFFLTEEGLKAAQSLGLDKNSQYGDAMFEDASVGNFELKKGSPALRVGVKNFEMNVGVTTPALKALAEKPTIRPLLVSVVSSKAIKTEWLGASFKNVETLGERSAAGLHDSKGALLVDLPSNSPAARNGLKKGDVVVQINGQAINTTEDLIQAYQRVKWVGKAELGIIRDQGSQTLSIKFK